MYIVLTAEYKRSLEKLNFIVEKTLRDLSRIFIGCKVVDEDYILCLTCDTFYKISV